jgi:Ca2+-binding EF-hand superfamily protein
VIIPEQHKRLFMRFDVNGDGRLDRKEFDALPPVLQNGVLDYIRGRKP